MDTLTKEKDDLAFSNSKLDNTNEKVGHELSLTQKALQEKEVEN